MTDPFKQNRDNSKEEETQPEESQEVEAIQLQDWELNNTDS